jgi:hypothetical protein
MTKQSLRTHVNVKSFFIKSRGCEKTVCHTLAQAKTYSRPTLFEPCKFNGLDSFKRRRQRQSLSTSPLGDTNSLLWFNPSRITSNLSSPALAHRPAISNSQRPAKGREALTYSLFWTLPSCINPLTASSTPTPQRKQSPTYTLHSKCEPTCSWFSAFLRSSPLSL